ncbi:hypothetical protein [Clostridium fungisolvens]|uniref:Peptide zinc metalloprotease protein n=1 Tax=Clostridium fungisolvens TaxID=1604897 RepID=A0A6V8SKI6_9CLOT|nr:hypothetical protein [Clostridium fungisolvens]GFP77744.1 hypothetical protein bsdtw1_03915 [Clostridium fungisolvens]
MEILVPVKNPKMSVELFDSSSEKQKYLIRLGKKQWVVSYIIYEILNNIDGKKNITEITESVNSKASIMIKQEDITTIIEKTLIPNKLINSDDDSHSEEELKKDKSLWFRVNILKSHIVQKFSFLCFFYTKKVALILGPLAIISQLYILAVSMSSSGINNIFSTGTKGIICMFVISTVVTLFHELGHASASMYYNVKPGDIGIGIYYMIPVYYSDVSSIWALNRKQRVVVDIGGMYFQAIMIAVLLLISLATKNNYIYTAVCILCINNFYNINPFIKLDGYWIFSDFIGVPNLHDIMKAYFNKKVLRRNDIRIDRLLDGFINSMRKKEKLLFYIYIGFSMCFVVFVAYFTTNLLFSCVVKAKEFYSMVLINMNLGLKSTVYEVIRWLYNNTMYAISVLFFIKMTYSFISRVIVSLKNMILKRWGAKNEKNNKYVQ